MTTPRLLLIVDDDDALRAMLAEQLSLDGEFAADEADSAAAAEAKLAQAGMRYDAILLDLGLPDADGCHFCAKLRGDGRRMPIIILAGENEVRDVVRCLNSGANDYLARPLRPPELLARIRAQLRTFDQSEDAAFAVGHYVFRPGAKLLLEPGMNRKVRLSDKESAILKYLYRAGGKPVPHRILLHEIWGDNSEVSIHTVESHVHRLRQKIECDPAHPRLLLTESDGYRLEATRPSSSGA